MGFTNRNLNIAIYNAQDTDDDHKIDEKEFASFVHDHEAIVNNLANNASQYNAMFKEIDSNNNGFITPDEVKAYWNAKHPENKGIEKTITRSFKLDADKKISMEGHYIY